MSKKWLDWSTGACREPGQGTAGHCDCARGTLSKKDGRPSRPARAANRGGGQRSVAVAHFTPCPKRRLDWSICARREPGREDSEALRLLTPHHVPKNGWAGRPARAANRGGGQRGVAVAHVASCPKKWLGGSTGACRKPGRGTAGRCGSPLARCSDKRARGLLAYKNRSADGRVHLICASMALLTQKIPWHHYALFSGWYFVKAAVKSASVAALFNKISTNASRCGNSCMFATCCIS